MKNVATMFSSETGLFRNFHFETLFFLLNGTKQYVFRKFRGILEDGNSETVTVSEKKTGSPERNSKKI